VVPKNRFRQNASCRGVYEAVQRTRIRVVGGRRAKRVRRAFVMGFVKTQY
jgi:hypothetical protein